MNHFITVKRIRRLGIDSYIVLVAGQPITQYPSMAGACQYIRRLKNTLDKQITMF